MTANDYLLVICVGIVCITFIGLFYHALFQKERTITIIVDQDDLKSFAQVLAILQQNHALGVEYNDEGDTVFIRATIDVSTYNRVRHQLLNLRTVEVY